MKKKTEMFKATFARINQYFEHSFIKNFDFSVKKI